MEGLSITPIGGYGEIGRNCLAVNIDGKIVVLDLGLRMDKYVELSETYDYAPLSGKLLIEKKAAPDISVIKDMEGEVIALCVSHAHLDHIGAIPFLANKLNTDIHATAFTAEIIFSMTDGERRPLKNSVIVHETRKKYPLADGIDVEFINVTHSCPGAGIIILHTKYGQIVYCNDFKLDETPVLGERTDTERLKELKNVKLLIINSLYSTTPGHTPSEKLVEGWLREIMRSEDVKGKKVIMTTFSSHISRLSLMLKSAKSAGRDVIFMGRSMNRYIQGAENVGLVDFSKQAKVIPYSSQAIEFVRTLKNPQKYVFVMTGNQGEPNSMLSKVIAKNELNLQRGDVVVFSSKVIPTSVNKRNREILEKELRRYQVKIFKDIHVSGHGAKEDEKKIIELTRPEYIVPVHGDIKRLRELKHFSIDELGYSKDKVKILKNGDELRLT